MTDPRPVRLRPEIEQEIRRIADLSYAASTACVKDTVENPNASMQDVRSALLGLVTGSTALLSFALTGLRSQTSPKGAMALGTFLEAYTREIVENARQSLPADQAARLREGLAVHDEAAEVCCGTVTQAFLNLIALYRG